MRKFIFFMLVVFILGCGKDKEQKPTDEGAQDKKNLSGLTGEIIFQSDRDGNWNIFRLKAGGGRFVRLTDNPADDEYPVYSPDGKQIAFKSNRTGKWQIYLMEPDGKRQRPVTKGEFDNYDPAWMPDGQKIVFTSDRGQGEKIYLIDIAAGEEQLLTEVNFRSGLANFSPDGKHMVFTGNELGWGIYLMDLNDKRIARVTSRGGSCRPDWSPDGKTIAYVSHLSDPSGDIWLMDAGGQNQRRLTTTPELSDYYPAWSADGQWIAYAASPDGRNGNWDLYVISVDGAKRMRLTDDESRNKFPDWIE